MKKLILAFAAGALILAAVAIADPRPGHLPRLLLVPKRHSELGVIYRRDAVYLVRVDPRTLKPPAAGLRLPRCGSAAAFAPGGSRLALGGADGRVCLVGTKSLRLRRVIETGADGDVMALQWSGSHLLALVQHEDDSLVAVDAGSRQVIARRALVGSLQQTAKTPAGLLLLYGPAKEIGPSRLFRFGPDGSLLQIATLDRIPSGFQFLGGEEGPTSHARPALAVDRSGNRAFVVGAGTPVAEIDLTTSLVTYHDLATPVSLLGKVHGWLEPAAQAKVLPEGPNREATWLGNGMLAVWGWNDRASINGDQHRFWAEPAGLKLVDTRDWSVRVLDSGATAMTVANGNLLAYSWLWDSTRKNPSGSGVTAYGPAGNQRFHLFGSRPFFSVQALGNRAFIRGTRSRYSVVDLNSGQVIRSIAGEPPELLLP